MGFTVGSYGMREELLAKWEALCKGEGRRARGEGRSTGAHRSPNTNSLPPGTSYLVISTSKKY
jgi:hypothetical protein